MEIYSDEGDLQRTLQTAIRVAAYQYGEYIEMTVRTCWVASAVTIADVLTVPDLDW